MLPKKPRCLREDDSEKALMGRSVAATAACRRLPPPHTSPLSVSSFLCVANASVHVCDPLVKKKEKERGSGAFSRCHSQARKGRREEDAGALSGLSAGKTSDRGPHYFPRLSGRS